MVFKEGRAEQLAAAPRVNRATWSVAMAELEAARSRLVRDGEDALEFEDVTAALPVTRRQRTKLNRQDLQHSGRLTAAAMKEVMVEEEGGVVRCRLCSWSTDIPGN